MEWGDLSCRGTLTSSQPGGHSLERPWGPPRFGGDLVTGGLGACAGHVSPLPVTRSGWFILDSSDSVAVGKKTAIYTVLQDFKKPVSDVTLMFIATIIFHG